ncbi:MAG TPA: transcriptional repressor [Opitutales bacterium]|nr:transcriptional repressor [Opitutales bacterium]
MQTNHQPDAEPTPRQERLTETGEGKDSKVVTIEDSRERFKAFLSECGLRVTNQRLAIFEAAFELDSHFTADELLEHARSLDSSVSRATVYRSLPIMVDSGLMREIDVGKDFKFYRIETEESNQQAQVFCTDCEKIFEIDAPFLEWYGATVSSKFGLVPVSQRLQITAQCDEYRKKGTCKHHD